MNNCKPAAEDYQLRDERKILFATACECVYNVGAMKEMDDKKKKAAAAAVAAAMLAGGVAGAADLPNDDKAYLDALNPTPIVQMIDEEEVIQTPDQNVDDEKKAQNEQRLQTIAKALLAPFYAVGAVIMKLGEMVMTGVLAPVAMFILNWVILAAVILGTAAACLKIAFPDIPLKKLLNKKSILSVLIGTAAVSILCEIIPLLWPGAGIWVFVFKVAAGLAVLLAIFMTAMKLINRKKESEQTA